MYAVLMLLGTAVLGTIIRDIHESQSMVIALFLGGDGSQMKGLLVYRGWFAALLFRRRFDQYIEQSTKLR